jgi:hypothetical protein
VWRDVDSATHDCQVLQAFTARREVPAFAATIGMPSTSRRVPFGLIAFLLYALSLVAPAIIEIHKPLLWGSPRDQPMFGIQCLGIGWFTIPWYANILLAVAAIGLAYRRYTLALWCSLAAFVLSLTTGMYFGTLIRTVHVGFFFWIGSMVVVFIAACAGLRPRLELPDDGSMPPMPPDHRSPPPPLDAAP